MFVCMCECARLDGMDIFLSRHQTAELMSSFLLQTGPTRIHTQHIHMYILTNTSHYVYTHQPCAYCICRHIMCLLLYTTDIHVHVHVLC